MDGGTKQNAWFFKKEFLNNHGKRCSFEESNDSSDYESSDYGEEYEELNKSYFKTWFLKLQKGLILSSPKVSQRLG